MKKNVFVALGVLGLLLMSASNGFAQFYELSIPGNSLRGQIKEVDFQHMSGFCYKPQTVGSLHSHLVFPPSANGKNISRLSATYYDNDATGFLRVTLFKVDRWTGSKTSVASLQSSPSGALDALQFMNQPKSQMTATGIDSNRYAWYLVVYFDQAGANLRLYHITIRYQ